MGGGNVYHRQGTLSHSGLSPRGRGKLCPSAVMRTSPRSIPAWAGETSSNLLPDCSRKVYPRVGGGNSTWRPLWRRIGGLSPRGRGKRIARDEYYHDGGSIPAWAGETTPAMPRMSTTPVYPRVGGGNIFPLHQQQPRLGLSPRGRGKQAHQPRAVIVVGSIPAWAGETRRRSRLSPRSPVYPRVGGGNLPAPAAPP